MFLQLRLGDRVWLADPSNPKTRVANGNILGFGGNALFHGRLIPAQYVRVNLSSVQVNKPLMVPVEEADQEKLEDALGSSVLWPRKLTFMED